MQPLFCFIEKEGGNLIKSKDDCIQHSDELIVWMFKTKAFDIFPDIQALILQPIGDKGIAVIGGDTIRGFTNLDQVLFLIYSLLTYIVPRFVLGDSHR